MSTDEVRAARAKLVAAVNAVAAASPAGAGNDYPARTSAPSDPVDQVNELHVISYSDGSGGDITGELSWRTLETLQEIAGVRMTAGRSALPHLSDRQIEELGEALVRAGTRVHRHERAARPARGRSAGLAGQTAPSFRVNIRVRDMDAAVHGEIHPPS